VGTVSLGPKWIDHTQDGVSYALGHLHPEFIDVAIPAVPATPNKPGRAAVNLKVWVHYSHHCFTQAPDKVPNATQEHYYTDKGRNDRRIFCPIRWEDSKRLPGIIQGLAGSNCFATRHHNYFAVRSVANPVTDAYFVYFAARLHSSSAIDLHVESAYVRSDAARVKQSARKVSFYTLLMKAWQGSQLRRPP